MYRFSYVFLCNYMAHMIMSLKCICSMLCATTCLLIRGFIVLKRRIVFLLEYTHLNFSDYLFKGKVYQDIVGSAYYVAPEVLRRKYGKEIDIWSAGVILYVLLSGVPPFWAETEKGIFDAILQGRIDFESLPWPIISNCAKDLVSKMLIQDPNKRITASQHPWLKEGRDASDKPIESAVLSRRDSAQYFYLQSHMRNCWQDYKDSAQYSDN
ncbi:putative protein kinase CAMK-CDPK family [Medicago truncatula]|uniref:Protein kinase domain-containing protein n=1 Tax=Medicago truncatula TaxID=3880 RepID=A0A396HWQ5_MEDTR|nr:putative protein kinase CAMK-CDPK family [Medicago truncatula]